MDTQADLRFVAEKIREALAHLETLPGERSVPGAFDHLKSVAAQVQGLEDSFKPSEVPPATSAPLPIASAPPFAPPGNVLQQFRQQFTPSSEAMGQTIRRLLADAPASAIGGDRVSHDPGSVGSMWQESSTGEGTTANEPAPQPAAETSTKRLPAERPTRKPDHNADVWDDLSRTEE
jgi:hypothetical protein